MADPTENSRNPADNDSLAGVLKSVLGKFLEGVDDMLPAVVVAYDRAENLVTVTPMVKILKTDGSQLDRADVASIPVLNIGGGNAVLSFPIKAGDLGWIKANDRDISLFMQNFETSAPNTLRKHDFGDALFIPDAFKNWTLDPADADSTVLQTLDGSQRVILHDDSVELVSDNQVTIDAPTTTTNNLLVFGTINTVGNITSQADVRAGGPPALGGVTVLGHGHEQGNDSGTDVQVKTDAPSPGL